MTELILPSQVGAALTEADLAKLQSQPFEIVPLFGNDDTGHFTPPYDGRTYVADPDFEAQHPRGAGGRWADKPGDNGRGKRPSGKLRKKADATALDEWLSTRVSRKAALEWTQKHDRDLVFHIEQVLAHGTIPEALQTPSAKAEQAMYRIGNRLYEATVVDGVEYGTILDSETGAPLAVVEGEATQCRLAPAMQKMKPFRGYIDLHTHPSGVGFSAGDMGHFLYTQQARRSVVFAGDYIYILDKPKGWQPPVVYGSLDTEGVAREAVRNFRNTVQQLKPLYEPPPNKDGSRNELRDLEAWIPHVHEAIQRFAKFWGLTYRREKGIGSGVSPTYTVDFTLRSAAAAPPPRSGQDFDDTSLYPPGVVPVEVEVEDEDDVREHWDAEHHPRGKTSPESTPGSFAPAAGGDLQAPARTGPASVAKVRALCKAQGLQLGGNIRGTRRAETVERESSKDYDWVMSKTWPRWNAYTEQYTGIVSDAAETKINAVCDLMQQLTALDNREYCALIDNTTGEVVGGVIERGETLSVATSVHRQTDLQKTYTSIHTHPTRIAISAKNFKSPVTVEAEPGAQSGPDLENFLMHPAVSSSIVVGGNMRYRIDKTPRAVDMIGKLMEKDPADPAAAIVTGMAAAGDQASRMLDWHLTEPRNRFLTDREFAVQRTHVLRAYDRYVVERNKATAEAADALGLRYRETRKTVYAADPEFETLHPRDPAGRWTDKPEASVQPPQNDAELQDLFDSQTATTQRREPEEAMVRAQFALGGGDLNVLIEHVGDLTHRMSESVTFNTAGYEHVREKVEKTLRWISNPEFRDIVARNLQGTAEYRGVPLAEHTQRVQRALARYAEAHRQVPVFNEAQWVARQAAIALGERRYEDARDMLRVLKGHLDQGREHWVQYAHRFDPQRFETWRARQRGYIVDADFETEHPRDAQGRWTDKGQSIQDVDLNDTMGTFPPGHYEALIEQLRVALQTGEVVRFPIESLGSKLQTHVTAGPQEKFLHMPSDDENFFGIWNPRTDLFATGSVGEGSGWGFHDATIDLIESIENPDLAPGGTRYGDPGQDYCRFSILNIGVPFKKVVGHDGPTFQGIVISPAYDRDDETLDRAYHEVERATRMLAAKTGATKKTKILARWGDGTYSIGTITNPPVPENRQSGWTRMPGGQRVGWRPQKFFSAADPEQTWTYAGPHKFGTVQVDLPEQAAAHLLAAANAIPAEDLAGEGREPHAHITVRYGLLPGVSAATLQAVLRSVSPFTVTLGTTSIFPPSEHSDNAAVVVVPVTAPELHTLHAALTETQRFKPDNFPEYQPHATLAYVKPEVAEKYAGLGVVNGVQFAVDAITVIEQNGNVHVLPLGVADFSLTFAVDPEFEAKHPRGEGGRWTAKGEVGGTHPLTFKTEEIDALAKEFGETKIADMSEAQLEAFTAFAHKQGYEFESTNRMFYPLRVLSNVRLVRFVREGSREHRGHAADALYKTRRPGVASASGPYGFAFLADSPEAKDAEHYGTYGTRKVEFTVSSALEVLHFADTSRQIIYRVQDVAKYAADPEFESKHPRGQGGKWAEKGGAAVADVPQPQRLQALSTLRKLLRFKAVLDFDRERFIYATDRATSHADLNRLLGNEKSDAGIRLLYRVGNITFPSPYLELFMPETPSATAERDLYRQAERALTAAGLITRDTDVSVVWWHRANDEDRQFAQDPEFETLHPRDPEGQWIEKPGGETATLQPAASGLHPWEQALVQSKGLESGGFTMDGASNTGVDLSEFARPGYLFSDGDTTWNAEYHDSALRVIQGLEDLKDRWEEVDQARFMHDTGAVRFTGLGLSFEVPPNAAQIQTLLKSTADLSPADTVFVDVSWDDPAPGAERAPGTRGVYFNFTPMELRNWLRTHLPSAYAQDPEFEAKHPRGQGGRWATKGGGSAAVAEAVPEIPLHRWELKAKEIYGTTTNPRRAGYLLTDGTMLDFGDPSNPRDNTRGTDHRDIWQAMEDDDTAGGTEGMLRFMEQTGAIRIDGNVETVHLLRPPTLRQRVALERAFPNGALAEFEGSNQAEVLPDFTGKPGKFRAWLRSVGTRGYAADPDFESKHPREDGGRFAPKGTAAKPPAGGMLAMTGQAEIGRIMRSFGPYSKAKASKLLNEMSRQQEAFNSALWAHREMLSTNEFRGAVKTPFRNQFGLWREALRSNYFIPGHRLIKAGVTSDQIVNDAILQAKYRVALTRWVLSRGGQKQFVTLYRGLNSVDPDQVKNAAKYMVGSWTDSRSLAKDFAIGRYRTSHTVNWRSEGTVLTAKVPISSIGLSYHAAPRLRSQHEYIVTGPVRVLDKDSEYWNDPNEGKVWVGAADALPGNTPGEFDVDLVAAAENAWPMELVVALLWPEVPDDLLEPEAALYAVDPEFEALHPRDPEGQWVNKPGEPLRVAPISGEGVGRNVGKIVAMDAYERDVPSPIRAEMEARWDLSVGISREEAVENLLDLYADALRTQLQKPEKLGFPRSSTDPVSVADAYLDWYQDVHDWTQAQAKQAGLDAHVAYAVVAATSQNVNWEENQRLAQMCFGMLKDLDTPVPAKVLAATNEKFATGKGVKGIPKNFRLLEGVTLRSLLDGALDPQASFAEQWRDGSAACAVLNSGFGAKYIDKPSVAVGTYEGFTKGLLLAYQNDVQQIHPLLRGPKTRSFFNVISDPRGSDDVAIDRHMWRALAVGTQINLKAVLRNVTAGDQAYELGFVPAFRKAPVGAYPVGADVIREATRRINRQYGTLLRPSQVQAITWGQQIERWPRMVMREWADAWRLAMVGRKKTKTREASPPDPSKLHDLAKRPMPHAPLTLMPNVMPFRLLATFGTNGGAPMHLDPIVSLPDLQRGDLDMLNDADDDEFEEAWIAAQRDWYLGYAADPEFESKHPRGEGGQFEDKPGGATALAEPLREWSAHPIADLSRMSDLPARGWKLVIDENFSTFGYTAEIQATHGDVIVNGLYRGRRSMMDDRRFFRLQYFRWRPGDDGMHIAMPDTATAGEEREKFRALEHVLRNAGLLQPHMSVTVSWVHPENRTYAVDPEFEAQHPRDPEGQWTEKPGGDVSDAVKAASPLPREPGTTPIPPGMVRGFHYTDDLASVLQHGLDVAHAKGESYGEPSAIWFSTEKPGDFKNYVEVFLTPEEIGLNGPDAYRWRKDPAAKQAVLDEYNQGNHDFYVTTTKIPPERFVTHHEPWHDRYRYVANNPRLREEVLRGEHDDLLDNPEYGPAIRKIKETYHYAVDPEFETLHPRDPEGQWVDKPGGGPAIMERVRVAEVAGSDGYRHMALFGQTSTIDLGHLPAKATTLVAVIDPDTGEAGVTGSDAVLHNTLLATMAPNEAWEDLDRFAHVVVDYWDQPHQLIVLTPPFVSGQTTPQSEVRSVRNLVRHLGLLGVKTDLPEGEFRIYYAFAENRSAFGTNPPTAGYVADPEFEQKHPRGEGGLFEDKPDAPRGKAPHEFTAADLVPLPKWEKLDRKLWRGEVYDAQGGLLGMLYAKPNGKFRVIRQPSGARTTMADAELPGEFEAQQFKKWKVLDLGYGKVPQWIFRPPAAFAADADFEAKHPRDPAGRWTESLAAGVQAIATTVGVSVNELRAAAQRGDLTAESLRETGVARAEGTLWFLRNTVETTLPEGVAARYDLTRNRIEVPARGRVSDATLRHEAAHQAWHMQLPAEVKQTWTRTLDASPALRDLLYERYLSGNQGYEGEVAEEIYASLNEGPERLRGLPEQWIEALHTVGLVRPYAKDADFEQQHPRDASGKFAAKGVTLYHVTLTSSVPKIQQKGLLLRQRSNWVQARSKKRYGNGEVYAFQNRVDALRWAARMDWEMFKGVGTGNISIVRFTGQDDWDIDQNDPLSQAGRQGHWLKRTDRVKPADIQDATPFDRAQVQALQKADEQIFKPLAATEFIDSEPGYGACRQCGFVDESRMGVCFGCFLAEDLTDLKDWERTMLSQFITDNPDWPRAAELRAKGYAVDPEFERKHPRGPKGSPTGGQWAEKPGGGDASAAEGAEEFVPEPVAAPPPTAAPTAEITQQPKKEIPIPKPEDLKHEDLAADMDKELNQLRTDAPKHAVLKGKVTAELADDISDGMRTEVDGFSPYLAGDSLNRVHNYIRDMERLIRGSASEFADVNAQDLYDLGVDSIRKLVYQEVYSNRAQWTDHGVRHVLANVTTQQGILNAMQEAGETISGRDRLLGMYAAVNHDIGYTHASVAQGGDAAVKASKQHPQMSAAIVAQEADTWDKGKIFTAEEFARGVEAVKTHSSTDLSMKDLVATSLRIADNTSLFAKDKLPSMFARVKGGAAILTRMGAAARENDLEGFEQLRGRLAGAVRQSGLDRNLQRDLLAGVRDINPRTPKYTLGVLAGEMQQVKAGSDAVVEMRIKHSKTDALLQDVFEMGQKQARGFLSDYGITTFDKNVYYLGKAKDKAVLKIVVEGAPITTKHAVDPEFETLHPRDPEGQWIEKPGGADGDTVAGSGSEGAGDTVLPTGTGSAGRAESIVQSPAAVGQPPALRAGTDSHITARTNKGDFSPAFADGLRRAIAGLPPAVQQWLDEGWSKEYGSYPGMQEVDMESADVPDFIKSQLRHARAATLNGYRILYKKGTVPDTESLLHELTHVAYQDLERRAGDIVEEAVQDGERAGTAMLDAAFSRKFRTKQPPPYEDPLYNAWSGARDARDMARWAKRYVKGGNKDITGSLELNLILPSYRLRDLATHLNLHVESTSDQWHVLAVAAGLNKRYGTTVRSCYRAEEFVTYKAGHDPAYASRLFAKLGRRANVPESLQAAFMADFSMATRYAEDPEFEGKHPRDEEGKFAPKPGGERPVPVAGHRPIADDARLTALIRKFRPDREPFLVSTPANLAVPLIDLVGQRLWLETARPSLALSVDPVDNLELYPTAGKQSLTDALQQSFEDAIHHQATGRYNENARGEKYMDVGGRLPRMQNGMDALVLNYLAADAERTGRDLSDTSVYTPEEINRIARERWAKEQVTLQRPNPKWEAYAAQLTEWNHRGQILGGEPAPTILVDDDALRNDPELFGARMQILEELAAAPVATHFGTTRVRLEHPDTDLGVFTLGGRTFTRDGSWDVKTNTVTGHPSVRTISHEIGHAIYEGVMMTAQVGLNELLEESFKAGLPMHNTRDDAGNIVKGVLTPDEMIRNPKNARERLWNALQEFRNVLDPPSAQGADRAKLAPTDYARSWATENIWDNSRVPAMGPYDKLTPRAGAPRWINQSFAELWAWHRAQQRWRGYPPQRAEALRSIPIDAQPSTPEVRKAFLNVIQFFRDVDREDRGPGGRLEQAGLLKHAADGAVRIVRHFYDRFGRRCIPANAVTCIEVHVADDGRSLGEVIYRAEDLQKQRAMQHGNTIDEPTRLGPDIRPARPEMQRFAVDPEFETLHPRDPEGQWIDKPGGTQAEVGTAPVRPEAPQALINLPSFRPGMPAPASAAQRAAWTEGETPEQAKIRTQLTALCTAAGVKLGGIWTDKVAPHADDEQDKDFDWVMEKTWARYEKYFPRYEDEPSAVAQQRIREIANLMEQLTEVDNREYHAVIDNATGELVGNVIERGEDQSVGATVFRLTKVGNTYTTLHTHPTVHEVGVTTLTTKSYTVKAPSGAHSCADVAFLFSHPQVTQSIVVTGDQRHLLQKSYECNRLFSSSRVNPNIGYKTRAEQEKARSQSAVLSAKSKAWDIMLDQVEGIELIFGQMLHGKITSQKQAEKVHADRVAQRVRAVERTASDLGCTFRTAGRKIYATATDAEKHLTFPAVARNIAPDSPVDFSLALTPRDGVRFAVDPDFESKHPRGDAGKFREKPDGDLAVADRPLWATPLADVTGPYPSQPWSEETEPVHRAWRERERAWEKAAREAISRGDLTPEEAKRLGLVMPNTKWELLPETLYHVTTSLSGVRASGGLKTRDELQQSEGKGLGGGQSDTISFTSDLETAEGIRRAILEGRRVARGEITVDDILKDAIAGTRADRPWINDLAHYRDRRWKPGDAIPEVLTRLARGQEYLYNTGSFTRDELPKGAEPIGEGWTDGTGKQRWTAAWVPMDAKRQREEAFGLWKESSTFREHAGGPLDPLFFLSDIDGLANTPADDIGVLQVKPVGKARGFQVSALGEWRTHTGAAVQVVRSFALDGSSEDLDTLELLDDGFVNDPIAWVIKHYAVDPEFEGKHPRDPEGQWTHKAGGGTATLPTVLSNTPVENMTLIDATGRLNMLGPSAYEADPTTAAGRASAEQLSTALIQLSRDANAEFAGMVDMRTGALIGDGVLKGERDKVANGPLLVALAKDPQREVIHVHTHPGELGIDGASWADMRFLLRYKQIRRAVIETPRATVVVERVPGGRVPYMDLGKLQDTYEDGFDAILTMVQSCQKSVECVQTKVQPSYTEFMGTMAKQMGLRYRVIPHGKTHAVVADPEFETKHPRGEGGRWTEKGGTTVDASGLDVQAQRNIEIIRRRERWSVGFWLRYDGVVDGLKEGADHFNHMRTRPPAAFGINKPTWGSREEHGQRVNEAMRKNVRVRVFRGTESASAGEIDFETEADLRDYFPRMQDLVQRLGANEDTVIVIAAHFRHADRQRYSAADFLSANSMADLGRGYAVDPEFEKQHPRGRGEQGGWWIEKPGSDAPPPEAGEAGISASRESSPRVLEAVRRLLTDKQTAKLRSALEKVEGLEPTGAIGRWEDGVEPSLAVRWQDGTRVRGELARLAKEYNQDAVLIWTNDIGNDARLSVQFHTTPPPRVLDALHQALTKAGIPGSSYLAAGREIVVYASESDRDTVQQQLRSVLQARQLSGNITLRKGKFELIFRDGYDAAIAAGKPTQEPARAHAKAAPPKPTADDKPVEDAISPAKAADTTGDITPPTDDEPRTGEAMFLSDILARAFAKRMRTKTKPPAAEPTANFTLRHTDAGA